MQRRVNLKEREKEMRKNCWIWSTQNAVCKTAVSLRSAHKRKKKPMKKRNASKKLFSGFLNNFLSIFARRMHPATTYYYYRCYYWIEFEYFACERKLNRNERRTLRTKEKNVGNENDEVDSCACKLWSELLLPFRSRVTISIALNPTRLSFLLHFTAGTVELGIGFSLFSIQREILVAQCSTRSKEK